MLNEFYWNTETMKKSTYMYKDLGGKLFIGPVWDMDWTSNSQISAGETSNYRAWMVVTRSAEAQANSWYKTLIGDPYFVTKLYECYKENRQNFEDIVKTGGILDQQKEYLLESGNANYQAGYLMHRSTFESEVERLRTFLKNRLDWMGSAVHQRRYAACFSWKVQGILCNLCDRDNFSSRKSTSDGRG